MTRSQHTAVHPDIAWTCARLQRRSERLESTIGLLVVLEALYIGVLWCVPAREVPLPFIIPLVVGIVILAPLGFANWLCKMKIKWLKRWRSDREYTFDGKTTGLARNIEALFDQITNRADLALATVHRANAMYFLGARMILRQATDPAWPTCNQGYADAQNALKELAAKAAAS